MSAVPTDGGERQASAGMRRLHAHVLTQLALMARLAGGEDAELAARAAPVSGWSVAEQLEHLVLVDRAVLTSLGRILDGLRRPPEPQGPAEPPLPPEPPRPPVPGINLVGRLVLGTGFMPRGRARTMPPYHPGAAPIAAVRAGIPEIDGGVRGLAPRLGELERAGGRARHRIFGGLGGRQWLRFLAVHHHHHLKIVSDIRRAQGLAALALPAR